MKKIPKFNSIRMLAIQIGLGYASLLIALALVSYIIHQGNKSMDASQAETRKIEEVRSAIHSIHYKLTELTLLGENVMEWDEHDYKQYHDKRMLLDSTLALFEERYKDTIPESPIDTVRQLFSQKEKLLMNIMETMGKQDSVNQELLKRLPSITRAATNNEQKKKGGMFSFLKKKKKQPVATSSMLYTLDKDVVQKQNAYKEQLETLIDSLTSCNVELNKQLELFIEVLWNESEYQMAEKARNNQKMRDETYEKTVDLLIAALVIFSLSCMVLHWSLLRRKRAERGLAEANKDIKRLLSEREKMIYSISHDIKAPLGVIDNNAEMIQKTDSGEGQRAGNIRQACSGILQLINSLLDFSRLNQGKEKAEQKTFHLGQLLDEVAVIHAQIASNKELRFIRELNGCEKTVKGDSIKLNRIVSNLLNNAVKFTKTGSVTLCCEYDDEKLDILVEDTGIGMSSEELNRIFIPYECKLNGMNTNGLGLGMCIVQKLTALLKGEITVQSIEGKGTSIKVVIPLEVTHELPDIPLLVTEGTSGTTCETASGAKKKATIEKNLYAGTRVLAIDDERLQLVTLQERLKQYDVQCDVCSNMAELVSLMRSNRYDLLLTDIQMGEFDGFKVLSLMRKSNIGNSKSIPIVAMTAREDKTKDDFRRDGFTDCIYKPIQMEELLRIIAEASQKDNRTACFDKLLNGVDNPQKILELFVQCNQELTKDLLKAAEDRDTKAIRKILHKIIPVWSEVGQDNILAGLQVTVKSEGATDWNKIAEEIREVEKAAKGMNLQAENRIRALS